MSTFQPKKILEQAQSEEAAGNTRMAATHYATLGLYLRRKGKLPESKKLLARAVQLHPSSARLYLHLAAVEAGLGNQGGSLSAMKAFLSTASVRGRLRDYEKQVIELVETNPGLVLAYYEKWLEHDRTEPKVFLRAAHSAVSAGESEKALHLYREAFVLAPKDKRVRAHLRQFLEHKGDEVRLHALESFESRRLDKEQFLAVLAPDEPVEEAKPAHTAAAVTNNASFTMDKSLGGMISDLEQQLEAEESSDNDLKPLLRQFRQGTERVVANDVAARFDLAHAYAEMGLVSESLTELKLIPHEGQWHLKSLLKQTELLMAQGSFLGALETSQEVARLEPSGSEFRSEALYQSAQVYLALGDFAQALQTLDILEKESPHYRDSRSLRIRIEESKRRWKHEQAG